MVDAALAVLEIGAVVLARVFGMAAISSRRDVAASSLEAWVSIGQEL